MRALMEMDASGTQVRIRVEGTALGPQDEVLVRVHEIPDGITTILWPQTVVIRHADGSEESCRLERVGATDVSFIRHADGMVGSVSADSG